jgi:N-sulfoglucosamine sulfohydrolase
LIFLRQIRCEKFKNQSILINLAGNPDYKNIQDEMKQALLMELERSGDPRVIGPQKDIFDTYERYVGTMREFPKPDKANY